MEEERRPQQEEPVETEQAEEPQATLPLQQPPLPPSQETRSEMGEADHRVDEQMGGLVPSPPPAPAQAVEQEEQRHEGDG